MTVKDWPASGEVRRITGWLKGEGPLVIIQSNILPHKAGSPRLCPAGFWTSLRMETP